MNLSELAEKGRNYAEQLQNDFRVHIATLIVQSAKSLKEKNLLKFIEKLPKENSDADPQ